MKAKQGTVIQDVHIDNHTAANEHTRAAVEALASAATANARAIEAIARAMQGGSAVGIQIESAN